MVYVIITKPKSSYSIEEYITELWCGEKQVSIPPQNQKQYSGELYYEEVTSLLSSLGYKKLNCTTVNIRR